MREDKTILYYNTNAYDFVAGTVNVNLSNTQDFFLGKLEKGAYILDFGCGSGRDTKYFLDKGYEVDAIDGSEELCKIASEYTGINVRNMLFDELDEIAKYDGIWACASILHLSQKDLKDVIRKMHTALKENGIIYTSFKYGDSETIRNGRYFSDMTEVKFENYMKDIDGLIIEEEWITNDGRPERGEEKWLNLILRKK